LLLKKLVEELALHEVYFHQPSLHRECDMLVKIRDVVCKVNEL